MISPFSAKLKTKINSVLFRISCCFSVLLLSACGVGGSSAVAPADLIFLNAEPEVGDESPLPSDVSWTGGNVIRTYPENSSGNSYIDDRALNRYYTLRYNSGHYTDTVGLDFLRFFAGEGGTFDDSQKYVIIRNSDIYGDSPSGILYEIADDGNVATVAATWSLGENQILSGDSLEVTIAGAGASAITIQYQVRSNGVVFGSGSSAYTVEVSNDYTYDVWEVPDICGISDSADGNRSDCQVSVSGVGTKYHLIKADYAALFYYHHDSHAVNDSNALGGSRNYGVMTRYENIPTTAGTVTYNIGAGIGRFSDYTDSANDKILSGTGSLEAKFADGEVRLNLEIKDHTGADFLDVTDVDIHISGNRNQFHSYDCHGAPAADDQKTCSGMFDYANNALDFDLGSSYGGAYLGDQANIHIGGEFYGPNAEEIAGGIHDGFNNRESGAGYDLTFQFIGKQE